VYVTGIAVCHRNCRNCRNSKPPSVSVTGGGAAGQKRYFIVYGNDDMLFTPIWAAGAAAIGVLLPQWEAVPAGSVPEMTNTILSRLGPGDTIQAIDIWGHANIGSMRLGSSDITREDYDPALSGYDGSDFKSLDALRQRMSASPYVGLEGCFVLRGEAGALLAAETQKFFGGSVSGPTGMHLGVYADGHVVLRPGEFR